MLPMPIAYFTQRLTRLIIVKCELLEEADDISCRRKGSQVHMICDKIEIVKNCDQKYFAISPSPIQAPT